MSSHIQRVVRAVDQLKSPSQLSTIVSSRDKLNGGHDPRLLVGAECGHPADHSLFTSFGLDQ